MRIFVKILLGIIILITLLIAAFFIYINSVKKIDYTMKEADIQTTSAELYAAYVKNEVSAAKKFNGKVINVEGIVDTVEFLDNRKIVVMFLNEGAFGFEGIRAELHESEKDNLEIGDNVILKGYCTGFTGNDVLIEYATVAEKSK